VPATLSLTLGAAAAFTPFTPGVAKTYLAQTTATVISSAGDAALSIADPSTTAPGHLVNNTFTLPSALKATATSTAGTAAAGGAVSGSPLTLLTYAGPVSNDPATIKLAQDIGTTDALRTGSYSKTLTFTLSTTTP
jgi:beta-glucosidase